MQKQQTETHNLKFLKEDRNQITNNTNNADCYPRVSAYSTTTGLSTENLPNSPYLLNVILSNYHHFGPLTAILSIIHSAVHGAKLIMCPHKISFNDVSQCWQTTGSYILRKKGDYIEK
jgi:hypothetical protein